jgi:hypothetical protein
MDINNKPRTFLKTDDNKVLNESYIRWIEKIGECMEVCTRSDGCNVLLGSTIRVCKKYNPTSYEKLNKYFE